MFCGKKDNPVNRLIAGPEAYICDFCVKMYFDFPFIAKMADSNKRCSFCGKDDKQKKYVLGLDVCICEDCLKICKEILDNDGKDNPKKS